MNNAIKYGKTLWHKVLAFLDRCDKIDLKNMNRIVRHNIFLRIRHNMTCFYMEQMLYCFHNTRKELIEMGSLIQFPTTIYISDDRISNWLELSFLTFYDAMIMRHPGNDCRLRKLKRVHCDNSLDANYHHIAGIFERLVSESYAAGQALLLITTPSQSKKLKELESYCMLQMQLLPSLLSNTLETIPVTETAEKKKERCSTEMYDLLNQLCKKAYYEGYHQICKAVSA